MFKKAVYAGSFDPLTNGHLWMIEQGADLFDELIVAIGQNPKKVYTFSLAERLSMLREVSRPMPRVRVESFDFQYLVHYAASIEAQYILRGIRNARDYEFENEMQDINADINPGVKTIYRFPPRPLVGVSSSMVKELIGPEGWEEVIKQYVPEPVLRKLKERFGKK